MYGERERDRESGREGGRPSSLLVSVVLGLEECTLLAVYIRKANGIRREFLNGRVCIGG